MDKTIRIEVYRGCVEDVQGLPPGYDYRIVDYDIQDESVREILETYSQDNLIDYLMDILSDEAKEEIIKNYEETKNEG